MVGTVYRCSDGDYYTRWEVDRKFRRGEWKPCLADRDRGIRLVGEEFGLRSLVAVPPSALPSWLEIRTDGHAARVVDTRRTTP